MLCGEAEVCIGFSARGMVGIALNSEIEDIAGLGTTLDFDIVTVGGAGVSIGVEPSDGAFGRVRPVGSLKATSFEVSYGEGASVNAGTVNRCKIKVF